LSAAARRGVKVEVIIDGWGSAITGRAVKAQLEACWNVPAGARDAQDLTPEFRVQMRRDGTVASTQLLNRERMNDPFFQAAAESANRALLNPRCQPLKLPPEKYDQWQTFTITFDPKDLT